MTFADHFRYDPPTFWGELYEDDFGSDWLVNCWKIYTVMDPICTRPIWATFQVFAVEFNFPV